MKKGGAVILQADFLLLGIWTVAVSKSRAAQEPPKAVSQHQPAPLPIAIGKQRIARDKQTIEIFQGNQSVPLAYLTELVVATMSMDKAQVEKLVGETVSLEQHPRQLGRWNILKGGAWGIMALPENVFRIREVLLCTAKNPIKVQVDGKVYRLRPGELLFVLG